MPHFVKSHEKSSIWPKLETFCTNYRVIDHIYTNTLEKLMKSGLCLADISDHLPVFCTMANTWPTNNEPRFFRYLRHFNENAFHQDLLAVNFKSLITSDCNEIICALLQTAMLLCAKHQNGNGSV